MCVCVSLGNAQRTQMDSKEMVVRMRISGGPEETREGCKELVELQGLVIRFVYQRHKKHLLLCLPGALHGSHDANMPEGVL